MIFNDAKIQALSKLSDVAGSLLNVASGESTPKFVRPTVVVHWDDTTHFTAYWDANGNVEIEATE